MPDRRDLAAALSGLSAETFTSSRRRTWDVLRVGSGPAVIVVHEVPGITPLVAAFAREVARRDMTAVLPSLLGTPGRAPTVGYTLAAAARACVSREFAMLATDRSSPVTDDLRDLATAEHARCGGPGVGVVGMCLTGNFALAMSVDPIVLAPVMSQPALPLTIGARRRAAVGVAPDDLARVRARVDEGLCVMGLRFSGDAKVPAERFDTLRRVLGDGFVGVEIDSSPTNPWGYSRSAHSVLTQDLGDQAGSPTRVALERVLDFLATRLDVGA
ncbi:MAG: dienelactone hydrolase family protein [Acidimicrobiales bacterium]